MLRCRFLCHVLNALFFIKIALKLSYFCKKMQNFQALGAPPPDPRASGSWRLCSLTFSLRLLGASPPDLIGLRRLGALPPDPQNSPSISNFWLHAWVYITVRWRPEVSTFGTKTLNFSRVIHFNSLTRIWIEKARAPWSSTVVRENPNKNWIWIA